MIKFLLLILLISIIAPVNASTTKIYLWRNEAGQLVYSDTPSPGAEEVKTNPGHVIESSSSIDIQLLDIQKEIVPEDYQIIINHPKNHDTIRDNTGSILISAMIQPRFKRGLKVQLILDGEAYQTPQNHTQFSLRNIDRGEHQIKMQVFNEEGKVIALSDPITFYMHRASIN
ncbi:DUF4124 domain-containing protein [Colwellia sp. 4_MG-2023]|jgi:hypothetical protein|uniref:DUF4124 domain-containing protein n=1 Tax=unclassified Colwellia TaxID=196834 RepID=UPI001C0973B2|nr:MULTISPECIES: DUF4124 domain-containing protein [unclassified Colwellia]MBU2924214.1 DUF4124 domain-containing protein [Colwellia sp. C2M11]MDO6486942.1 DUF4124 domain-containing protein [Colwellia sp. 6_MG-2023]MDO6506268.1 DUF4124 domain-containing protein [Colwellia sp. 5_MG-2023]MDO6554672.1 DUF4124 domain-containing protein [Colwellia sp. 4_MG-2023]MDO6652125.1 DUF4124 domain-containing protein [Colwellia sp. 3_MG-2023]